MLKSIVVLAIAAGAVAAFALPASAAASWKHHATPIAADVQLGFTGNVRLQTALGAFECQITGRATFLAGQTTGTAETFVPHPTDTTTNCKGLGGVAFCQFHNLVPQAPNWTIHTAAFQTTELVTDEGGAQTTVGGIQHSQAATITVKDISSPVTGGFCPWKELRLTGGTVGVIPTTPATVKQVQLTGILQFDIESAGGTSKGHALISGTLQIEGAGSGTYSI